MQTDLKDWEGFFEKQLIPLVAEVKTVEQLKMVARVLVEQLYQKNNEGERARAEAELSAIEQLADLPQLSFQEKIGHLTMWLRNIKEHRIALQKLYIDTGGDTQVVADYLGQDVLPSVAVDQKESPAVHEQALTNTVEIATREMLADAMRLSFKEAVIDCFFIPKHALPERTDGAALPWILSPAGFDQLLDLVLPSLLRIGGDGLATVVGNVCSTLTKEAKRRKLQGYAQVNLPKDDPNQRQRIALARRKVVDDIKLALQSAFQAFLDEKPDRHPLALLSRALQSYITMEDAHRKKDKTHEKNTQYKMKIEEQLNKAQSASDLQCDLSVFTFEDLKVVVDYISQSDNDKGYGGILKRFKSHIQSLQEKSGQQPVEAKDLELTYKDLDSFSVGGRTIIGEAYALMLFLQEDTFNFQKLQGFRMFKTGNNTPKFALSGYIAQYVAGLGRTTGGRLKQYSNAMPEVDRHILVRGIASCFEVVAQPPTKTEKRATARPGDLLASIRDDSEESEVTTSGVTRLTPAKKLIHELTEAAGESHNEIAATILDGLTELERHYSERKAGHQSTKRKDILKDFAVHQGLIAVREKIKVFYQVFTGLKYNAVHKPGVERCFAELQKLLTLAHLEQCQVIPPEATNTLTQVLDSDPAISLTIRQQLADIMKDLTRLLQQLHTPELRPDEHMRNITADYMQWLSARMLPRQPTPASQP